MTKIFLILMCLSLPTQAYIENRSLYPLGEAESQMANTGVAVRGSSGSAFFNPAGLASLRERSLSLSGNTFMQFKTDAKPFLVLDGKDLDFSASGTQVVPSSLVSTWTEGPWTMAFSVYVPELLRTSFIQNFPTTNFEIELSRAIDYQFLLFGLSAGGSFTTSLDFGAGCFFSQYQSSQMVSLVAKPKSGTGQAVIINNYNSIDTKGFLCQAGLQMNSSETNRLGMVLKLPIIQISGQGKYSRFTQDVAGARAATGIQDKAAKYSVPMDLSIGLSNTSINGVNFLFDLSYQFPEDFEAIEGLSARTKAVGTFRYSAGIEYLLKENFKVRGGYGYNPGAIEILADGDARENYQIFTTGIQYSSGPSTTGIGFYKADSKGESRLSATRMGSIQTSVTAIMLNTGFAF